MEVFAEISLLIAIAALISLAARLLRQPLIIGYIATGLVVGPFFLNLITAPETLRLFSEIGISLLLFIVGLSLTPHVVKRFGRVALLTGLGQLFFTILIGMAAALLFGFGFVPSLYIGIALAFSSTIIILKLLSDRGDTEKLYGRIAIGFLLLQDLVAIVLLFAIPLVSTEGGSVASTIFQLLRGVVLASFVFIAAFYILPYLNRFLSRSQELLFLFSIAWGLGLATLFQQIGFSLESGALIAGVTLSALPSHHEIRARLRPLRDFFIVVFFILLGAQMQIGHLQEVLVPALVFSTIVIIGNPLILMAVMGWLGHQRKTSFQTGLTVAQISEFSLILVALGVSLGHLKPEILSMTTLVALITIFTSTYLILYADRVYRVLAPALKIFERKHVSAKEEKPKKYPLILFGYNRIGYDFMRTFQRMEKEFLVVDYDPDVIAQLTQQNIDSTYGDAGNIDLLEQLDFASSTLVISTIPDYDTNILILREAKRVNPQAMVMTVAHTVDDAMELYKEGADYVIMPHFLGGTYASMLVEQTELDPAAFGDMKKKHITYLYKRRAVGHEHPVPEKLR